MFGPSILVNPVTQPGATSRSLYLPPAAGWYDFWTGRETQGGKRIEAPAELDRIPLYVKAGTILPLGPKIEYAGEKPDAPITLRIYPGADSTFNLYEDAGDSYAYENGAYSITPINWDEATHQLTIGKRTGQFPGMPPTHTFRLVFVRGNHGAGPEEQSDFDREVIYRGETLSVAMPHE
jgi:alpha-D-xyloside xylohydrolase